VFSFFFLLIRNNYEPYVIFLEGVTRNPTRK
jgi:hypothetical protein